jgi:phospholipase/carboxylesterase
VPGESVAHVARGAAIGDHHLLPPVDDAANRFDLSARPGPRPRTTPTNPHIQLDQNAPPELQELLFERARALAGVRVEPSMISVPGARAFVLGEEVASGPLEAFMIGREFAHLHPPTDGSLHMMLPLKLAGAVDSHGWGELHPVARMGVIPPNAMMVYGPRDEGELEVVCELLRASHAFATGPAQAA